MGIYVFYITTDKRLVDTSPSVYDELLLEGNRVVWLRTERVVNSFQTTDEAYGDANPAPGEAILGVVEV